MTPPVITLIAIVVAPVVLLMLLRINAALVFLSLCLGSVLVQFGAGDASSLLTDHADQLPQQAANAGSDTVKLVLLLLPVVLTLIFMIRTVSGSGRLLLNALPSIGVGMLGALLVVPLLPPGLSHNIVDSSLWEQVKRTQDIIVSASAVVCLLVLWMQRPKTGGHHRLGKHKG